MIKYKQIADTLRSGIQNGSYKQTLPTEQQLCEQFQVSRQTIRQALAVLQSEKLIERRQGSGSYIRETAEESSERLSAATPAERLSIAVVTTYISDYIFPGILREIESELAANNSTPLLFATQNQVATERRILNTLLEMDVLDGVLVEGTKTGFPNPNLDLYQKLIDRDIPLVFFHGNYPELKDTLSVLDDNFAGGEMLVDYLYQKGHRAIAGIFKSDDIQGHQRYAGYAAGLHKYGLPFDDSHVLWYDTELKRRIFEHYFDPDITSQVIGGCSAVICYNDEIAAHVVTGLTQSGIAVPEKMAVVSFDNSHYSELSVPRITSLSHGENNVGRQAARTLIRLIRREPCQSLLVPWVLTEKESS
ncbi:MAG: GntR family transcriptional regulator [Parasporobacterium sp.]|nr:GntR family transcriptional regulator [Parasporobacterium sp.]